MTATGFQAMAIRKQIAADAFIAYVVNVTKTGEDVAALVLEYYLSERLVKLDAVTGEFNVKHGALLDARVLLNAIDALTAQA